MEQLVLLLNDSDPEGEMLSILAVRDAANGKVRMDGTTITYVHDGSETSTGASHTPSATAWSPRPQR